MRTPPIEDLNRIAEESHEFARYFRDSRILLTGASGFVGTWILQSLIHLNIHSDLNADIDITTRNPAQFNGYLDLVPGKNLRINVIDCNLGSGELFTKTKGKRYDLVFHGATPASTLAKDTKYEELHSGTFEGLNEIIKTGLQTSGKSIVLHLSSGAVYGLEAREDRIILENRSPAGVQTFLDPYARIKLETENLLLRASSDGLLLGANPRLFAFAGPGIPVNDKFAIGSFISDAMSGKRIQLIGSPETRRSYMYPSDLVQALFSLSLHPTFETTHIGSSESFSMSEIAMEISDTFLGKGVDVVNSSVRPNYYVPDTHDTFKRLGFRPQISFHSAIRKWREWLNT